MATKSKAEVEREEKMQKLVAERQTAQAEVEKHATERAAAERACRAAKKKVEELNAEIVKVATS